MVEEFEKKYSRFREDTFLYSLNKKKQIEADSEFLELLKISKEVSFNTENYFDITLLPILENN
jgi:thiamine biosynthesis lipoprotein ApbE